MESIVLRGLRLGSRVDYATVDGKFLLFCSLVWVVDVAGWLSAVFLLSVVGVRVPCLLGLA